MPLPLSPMYVPMEVYLRMSKFKAPKFIAHTHTHIVSTYIQMIDDLDV